jgi:hypothetical protein
MRARSVACSTSGSRQARSSVAQVNCLVIEQIRNSVRGVNGDAPLGIGEPPGMTYQHFARADDRDGAAGAGMVAGKHLERPVEPGGEGIRHAPEGRAPARRL